MYLEELCELEEVIAPVFCQLPVIVVCINDGGLEMSFLYLM